MEKWTQLEQARDHVESLITAKLFTKAMCLCVEEDVNSVGAAHPKTSQGLDLSTFLQQNLLGQYETKLRELGAAVVAYLADVEAEDLLDIGMKNWKSNAYDALTPNRFRALDKKGKRRISCYQSSSSVVWTSSR